MLPHFLRILIVAISICFSPAVADAEEWFGVNDLLRLEAFRSAEFTPDGKYLIYEKARAYREAPRFGRYYLFGDDRTQTFVRDLAGVSKDKNLCPHDTVFVGCRIASISPGGRFVALYVFTSSSVSVAVHDLIQSKTSVFSITPRIDASLKQPVWLDEATFAVAAHSGKDLPSLFTVQTGSAESLLKKWPESWEGRKPTSSMLGSGRFFEKRESTGALLKVSISSGQQEVLARGAFIDLQISPDRKLLAGLKRTSLGAVSRNEKLIGSRYSHELVILDLNGREALKLPKTKRDFLRNSVSWSDSGAKLSVFSKSADRSWSSGRFEIIDIHNKRFHEVDLGTYEVADGYAGVWRTPPLWVGEHFVFRVERDTDGSYAWAAYEPEAGTIEIISGNLDVGAGPILLERNQSVFVTIDNRLWELALNSELKRALEGHAGRLVAWYRRDRYGNPYSPNSDQRFVLLQTFEEDSSFLRSFDAITEELNVVKMARPNVEVLAFDDQRETFFVTTIHQNVSTARLLAANSQRVIATANEHLADLFEPTPIQLQRSDSLRNDGADWLLLPSNSCGLEKHPIVVTFYPGRKHRNRLRDRMSDADPYSPFLFVSHGYAVLVVSVSNVAEADDNIFDLWTSELEDAVRNAERFECVDTGRVALMGHSFAGYAALGVATRSNTFDAIIASSPISNLQSLYGSFDRRKSALLNYDVDMTTALLAEGGQLRLGGAPWELPHLYDSLSPINYVEDINTPIMLIHGDLDFVSITQSEEMFTALRRLEKDSVFVRYWGEAHVITSPANIEDVWNRISIWLEAGFREH